MNRFTVIVCSLVALIPLCAAAQQTAVAIDVRNYPSLGLAVLHPADLDGNSMTREFYQERQNGQLYEIRGVAVRSSGICLGQWFSPDAVVAVLPGDVIKPNSGSVQSATDGGRWRYVIQGVNGGYYEIAIDFGC